MPHHSFARGALRTVMTTVAAHRAAASFDDGAHTCPICRETYVDAFSTLCGHTFCFACINRHLEHGSTCPSCSQPLSSDSLFPNLALDKLLRDLSRSGQIPGASVSSPREGAGSPAGLGVVGASVRGRASELADAVTDLPLEQLTPLLRVIADKHKQLVMDDKQVSMHVLRDFLALSHRRKNEAVDALEREIGCIDDDLEWVERQVAELGGSRALDAFAEEASRETDPRELARRRALGDATGGAASSRAGHAQVASAESDARNAAAVSSAVAANHAASMVCEMLGAWGLDGGVGGGVRGRHDSRRGSRDGKDRRASLPGDAAPGSKRSSMDMMRGTGPSKPGASGGESPEELRRTPSKDSDGSSGERSSGEKEPRRGTEGASTPRGNNGNGGDDCTAGFPQTGSPKKQARGAGAARMDPAEARAHLDRVALSRGKRDKIVRHFAAAQRLYSEIRGRSGGFGSEDAMRSSTPTKTSKKSARDDLERFGAAVDAFASKNRLRVVGELRHADPLSSAPSTSIVSSIEFDNEKRIFATAGVSKRIQFFDFRDVCSGVGRDGNDARLATHAINTRSKLSCLSYNAFVTGRVASSDYEGVVAVWDAETRTAVCEFEEHDKRAWTVDFCRADAKLLASGSDDGRVKLWSTDAEASVLELDVRANVCCARFGPNDARALAVGCADHRVHLFDLRYPAEAVAVLSGHRKATSYVRFLSSGDELISASTDSTMCVWDVRARAVREAAARAPHARPVAGLRPARVLEGHVNEKNFVGLSVGGGDLIACGSETNEVFVYHKSFDRPMVKYCFDDETERGGGGERGERGEGRGGGRSGGRDDESGGPAMPAHFISATCWRGEDDILLAANSSGSIKALQLVEA